MTLHHRAAAVAGMAAISALALGGCAGTTGGSDTTTLNYFTWNSQASMQPVVDAFEEAHPDIKIELSSANNDPIEYGQTLLARASGNQIPDVFHLSLETRAEILDAGLAKDLTDMDFLEGSDKTAQAMYSKDDKVYGMSLSGWAGVIIYNVDLLKQVGYDAVPTDLDGFIELGKALKDAGITPYMEDTAGPSGTFVPMIGGQYAAEGETDEALFAGDESFETWIPQIEQWQRIVDEGVMPAEVVGVGGDQIKQNFTAGKLAMYRSGAWDFPDLDSAGIDYSTAPIPAADGGEPYVGGGPDSPYALSAALEGDKLEAAETFLSFLNSAEGLELAEEHLGQVSTSTNYSAAVAPQIADVYKDYIQQGKYYWLNWPRDGATMSAELAAQFQLLIQGQTTPEDVAAALDTKWQG